MFNRVLNPSFAVKDAVTFAKTWSNLEKLGEGVATLDNAAWQDVVACISFGGLVDDPTAALEKLSAYEAAASEAHGVPRERKARAGVAATDFVVPPTFKSYKSTIKGAIEHGVELLDANGMPRSRGDVTSDLKEAKKVDKTEEEKLGTATETWLAIFGKVDSTNPATIDAVNKIINAIEARGMLTPAVSAATIPGLAA